MLDSAALFVTKTEIKKILTDIDADESESLDFFECLKVGALCVRGNTRVFLKMISHLGFRKALWDCIWGL